MTLEEMCDYAKTVDEYHKETVTINTGTQYFIQGLKSSWNTDDEIVIPETEAFIIQLTEKIGIKAAVDKEKLYNAILENKDVIYDIIEKAYNTHFVCLQEG